MAIYCWMVLTGDFLSSPFNFKIRYSTLSKKKCSDFVGWMDIVQLTYNVNKMEI